MLKLRTSVFRMLLLCLAAAVLLPPGSAAQTVTGSISGTVHDPQGAVVPGATATVINESNSDSRVAVTDDRGDFQVTNLPPGRYTVRVELASFRAYERKNVVLSSSERVSVGTIALEVGGLGETVTVEATGSHVNTTETQHGGVVTRTQIEQIQVLGRDVTSLMRLLPGVRYTAPVDSMGGTFGVDMPNVGGLPADWGRVIIDGVVGNEIGNSGMNAQMVNLDAIAEVRLLNNSYRAEYGQSGGSQLQIVTRGGSSQYHGSGYYYGRHERFNSTEYFRARSQRLNGIDPFPPKYRFNTYGANVGGPVLKDKKSLFFFYSVEAPQVQRPQSVQNWRMPSALERQGDFSQTFDAQGRLINIRDPRKTGQACNAATGGPGCFDGNVIPASMINSAHMQAMLRLMPMPEYDPRTTQGNYNYDTEEVIDIPKLNNVARIDWRPTQSDSFSFTLKDWWQDQRGARITAGPSNWQWFFAHYKNTDRGFTGNYTKILRSNLVWDTDFGSRQQTEVFYPLNDAEWTKASRTNAGFTAPQFHPELNPRDVLPKVSFGFPAATGSPNFSYDSRLSDKGIAWLHSVRSNVTYIRGRHALKTGIYYEKSINSEGKGGVGGGAWAGDYNFTVDSANTLDTNYAFANALVGNFTSYTETDGYADVKGNRPTVELYGQDTWKVSRTLTVDYGMRFLWFRPWASTKEGTRSASWDPDRYIPGGSPLLYTPVRVNNQNFAQNPVTGELRAPVYVGSFVPNTGDPYNGMVTNEEWPTYGVGFRVSQGIQPEGRVGLAWDITGSGKTSLHASLGRYHNAFVNANGLDVLARQPPAQNNPVLRYATIALLQTPEARAAFDTTPSNITGFQHVAPTPKSLNYSIGVQRELGWGTVLDVTYAGSKTREHRGDLPVQRPALRHQLHRRPPGEHRSADGRRAPGQLPSALSRIWHPRRSSEHRRHRLQLHAGAAESPLHQRLSVCARLHPRQGIRQTDHQSVCRRGSGLVLARTDWQHPAAQLDGELHLGRSGRQPPVGQLADPGRARRLAALGQYRVCLGRLVGRDLHDDGQLRLLRRRRRRPYRHDGCGSDRRRQSRSEPRRLRLVSRLGRIRASVRPAGSRQRGGAVLPAALDQEHRPVDVQEFRGGRRQAGADSLGDLQPVQHGELVWHQYHRPVQSRR